MLAPAAALETASLLPFVGEKILQAAKQKSAKAPLVRVRAGQLIAGEQATKKLLREVLRFFGTKAAPANISVKRIPISAAKLFERVGGLRRGALSSGHHDAPVRGGKHRCPGRAVRTAVAILWHGRSVASTRRDPSPFRRVARPSWTLPVARGVHAALNAERRVHRRRGIAIAEPRRAGGRIGLANAGDRSPENRKSYDARRFKSAGGR